MGSRFVILQHTAKGQSHFDLLLEVEGQERLRTWQLAHWPLKPGESCPCKSIGDHRRAYLDYEGEVSGGRGVVARVALGTWTEDAGAIVLSTGERLQLQGNAMRRED